MKMMRTVIFFLMMLSLWPSLGRAGMPDPAKAEEFRARDGLPNLFAKINQGKTVRIAYLGGSITAASGWRVKTLAWFKSAYPQAEFEEINAAISGTGSDFSACRLEDDVLSHNPDLVFLECRVNGADGVPWESVEGIVRHTWREFPQADICFVYTINQSMLPQIQDGKNVAFGEIMEQIANRYGIPSIDLGVEVARREKEGRLTFKADAREPGKLWFTKDGVHPLDDGHQLYCNIIAQSLRKIEGIAGWKDHLLGEPIRPDCWENASLLSLNAATLSDGWIPVDMQTDPVYREETVRTRKMLRDAVRSSKAGETITVNWTGTTIAFTDIPTVGPTTVEVVVDGQHRSTFVREPREYNGAIKQTLSQHFRLPILPSGDHEAVLTVTELPEKGVYYAGQVMVVGE